MKTNFYVLLLSILGLGQTLFAGASASKGVQKAPAVVARNSGISLAKGGVLPGPVPVVIPRKPGLPVALPTHSSSMRLTPVVAGWSAVLPRRHIHTAPVVKTPAAESKNWVQPFSLTSLHKMEEVFQTAKADPHMLPGLPHDGCFQRAVLVSYALLKAGIKCQIVSITKADGAPFPALDPRYLWGEHFTVLIDLQSPILGEQPQVLVADPMLLENVLSLRELLQIFDPSGQSRFKLREVVLPEHGVFADSIRNHFAGLIPESERRQAIRAKLERSLSPEIQAEMRDKIYFNVMEFAGSTVDLNPGKEIALISNGFGTQMLSSEMLWEKIIPEAMTDENGVGRSLFSAIALFQESLSTLEDAKDGAHVLERAFLVAALDGMLAPCEFDARYKAARSLLNIVRDLLNGAKGGFDAPHDAEMTVPGFFQLFKSLSNGLRLDHVGALLSEIDSMKEIAHPFAAQSVSNLQMAIAGRDVLDADGYRKSLLLKNVR
jgi:hypothetical protein